MPKTEVRDVAVQRKKLVKLNPDMYTADLEQ